MPAAYKGLGYHELNAMLNLYGPSGEIQFEADREAAHQYFLQHVNNNTVFFHDLEEKLDYLVKNQYYERETLDQYTMNFIRQHELSKSGPAFGEIDLVSSHVPWAPWPQVVDWNTIGDGTVFAPQAANGTQVKDVWPDPAKVQHAYSESIQYSLSTLISYLQNYGDDNTVMVFLGDHQAQTVASGVDADHDVPITIVAKDKSVLDRVAGWGWTDGLRPSPHAPVWPMSSFRDKFLAAFGDQVTK